MKRKKAIFLPLPVNSEELQLAVEGGLKDLNLELRHDFIRALKISEGDKGLSTRDHYRIFSELKVPCFKDSCAIAEKLDVGLECKNYPFEKSGADPYIDHVFSNGFDQSEFLKFIEEIHHFGTVKNSQEIREIRKQLILSFRNQNNSVCWEDLFAFSAACGYQLVCRLVKDDEALIRRLNYPV